MTADRTAARVAEYERAALEAERLGAHPAASDRGAMGERYTYRRRLKPADVGAAAGIAAAVGVAAFYVGCLLLQRTPLAQPRLDEARRPTKSSGRGRG